MISPSQSTFSPTSVKLWVSLSTFLSTHLKRFLPLHPPTNELSAASHFSFTANIHVQHFTSVLPVCTHQKGVPLRLALSHTPYVRALSCISPLALIVVEHRMFFVSLTSQCQNCCLSISFAPVQEGAVQVAFLVLNLPCPLHFATDPGNTVLFKRENSDEGNKNRYLSPDYTGKLNFVDSILQNNGY